MALFRRMMRRPNCLRPSTTIRLLDGIRRRRLYRVMQLTKQRLRPHRGSTQSPGTSWLPMIVRLIRHGARAPLKWSMAQSRLRPLWVMLNRRVQSIRSPILGALRLWMLAELRPIRHSTLRQRESIRLLGKLTLGRLSKSRKWITVRRPVMTVRPKGLRRSLTTPLLVGHPSLKPWMDRQNTKRRIILRRGSII